jgi:hypothetical protein
MLYLLVAGLAVIGATLSVLPASVAAGLIATGTKGQFKLTNVSGTAWSGRGDANVAPFAPGQAPLVIRNVEWTVQRWRMLMGELALALRFNGPELSGGVDVTRSINQILARNLKVSLPASLVTVNVPAAREWKTPGMVQLTSDSLLFTPRGIRGVGELNWRGAEAVGIGAIGDYRALVKGSGEGPAAVDLTTLRGQIRLEGRGELSPNNQLRMNVNLNVDGPNRALLLPLFGMIGRQQPDGSVAIEIDSRKAPRPAPMKRSSSTNGVERYGDQPLPA